MAVRTKNDFIPNDVKLGGKVGRIALLTGSYDLDFERKIKLSYPLAQGRTWGMYADFRDVTRHLIAGYYRGKSTVSMRDP